jgi:hypothetical protein
MILVIGVVLFAVFGLINVFSPSTGWYLSVGWKFKDAEPSDVVLLLHRIGGFFCLQLLLSSLLLP